MTAPESEVDRAYVRRAIDLASTAIGRTAPNPPVGCVIVKDGRIIGEGYHAKAGTLHAERVALAALTESPVGATAYVTLEPCNHHGRTPPCTEGLLDAGIARVVAGTVDPNPQVAGSGLARLRDAGVSVTHGVLEAECKALIAPFVRHILTGRPLVTLKVATTLDGKIATAQGHSRWVTGPEAREDVHRLRDHVDAIAVGAGTLRADDPQLTTRLPNGQGRSPLRVVVSSRLDVPRHARVFGPDLAPGTLVICAEAGAAERSSLIDRGVQVQSVGAGPSGGVALEGLLDALGQRDVMWLLVEGGTGLATAFLEAGLVDHLRVYFAPKLVGGDGLGWAGPLGIRNMNDAVQWSIDEVRTFGTDVRIDARRTRHD